VHGAIDPPSSVGSEPNVPVETALGLQIVAGQVVALGVVVLAGALRSWAAAQALGAGAAVCVVATGLAWLVTAEWRRQRAATVMARTALATLVKYAATVGGFAVVFTRLEAGLPLVLLGWIAAWSAYIWVPLLRGGARGGPADRSG
jgi:hypothetical protein